MSLVAPASSVQWLPKERSAKKLPYKNAVWIHGFQLRGALRETKRIKRNLKL